MSIRPLILLWHYNRYCGGVIFVLVSFLSPHNLLFNSFYCFVSTSIPCFKESKLPLISWEWKTFLVYFLPSPGGGFFQNGCFIFPWHVLLPLSFFSSLIHSPLPFFPVEVLSKHHVSCLLLFFAWIWNMYSQPLHLFLFIWALHASSSLNISLRAEWHWLICSLFPSSSCLDREARKDRVLGRRSITWVSVLFICKLLKISLMLELLKVYRKFLKMVQRVPTYSSRPRYVYMTALLSSNSQTIKSTHLKFTIQQFLKFTELCIPEHLHHSKE